MVHHLDEFHSEQSAQRLLFEFEAHIRDVNREAISAAAGAIGREQMFHLATTVAHIRARYLKEVLAVSRLPDGALPDADALRRLRAWREAYEETLQGVGALRHAMKRGYLMFDEAAGEAIEAPAQA